MTDKHLLITVSDICSMAGIHFISSFFKDKKDFKITLLYVAPATGSINPDLDDAWRSPEEKDQIKISRQIEYILKNSKDLLCKSGFKSENIYTKITAKLQSKVKDIIYEGQSGNYDAVVLGCRTASRFEKFLDESVSDEILKQTTTFPLWICRSPEIGRKNILICLDGSDTSLRVVDHVGFMIGNQEEHHVTLFHVASSEKINIDKSFEEARSTLLAHNVSEDRILTKTVKSRLVTRAIRQEIKDHKYAVVAVGLLGRQHEGIKEWFISSKSLDLVKNIDKIVLWGCH